LIFLVLKQIHAMYSIHGDQMFVFTEKVLCLTKYAKIHRINFFNKQNLSFKI